MNEKIIVVVGEGRVQKILIPKGSDFEVEVLDFDTDWDEESQTKLGDQLEELEESGKYEVKYE